MLIAIGTLMQGACPEPRTVQTNPQSRLDPLGAPLKNPSRPLGFTVPNPPQDLFSGFHRRGPQDIMIRIEDDPASAKNGTVPVQPGVHERPGHNWIKESAQGIHRHRCPPRHRTRVVPRNQGITRADGRAVRLRPAGQELRHAGPRFRGTAVAQAGIPAVSLQQTAKAPGRHSPMQGMKTMHAPDEGVQG